MTRWKLPSFFAFFLYYFTIQLALGQPAVDLFFGTFIPPPWWFLLGSTGVLFACLAGLMPGLLSRDGLQVSALGRAWPVTRNDAFVGLSSGGAIYLFKEGYARLVHPMVSGSLGNVPLTQAFRLLGRTPWDRAGFIAGIVILGPLAEEIVFSAYALSSMERVWGGTPARTACYVVVSSILFCAMHQTGHILYSLGYLMTGILFRLVYARSRSLPAVFLAHAAVNLLVDVL